MRYRTEYDSPLGRITLASDGENLTGLWFEGQKYYMAKWEDAVFCEELAVFCSVKIWLNEYFNGKNPSIETIPLKPEGTEFQKRVWMELLKISYGGTTTYGAIGKALGIKSGQAVGGAVGRNPISILIPCHRVVGKGGALTGYAGGVERKRDLLKLEKSVIIVGRR